MAGTEAIVVFAGRDRTRLRFPSLRYDEKGLVEVGQALSDVAGLTAITVNPVSGSVLVKHQGGREPIFDRLRQRGFSILDGAPATLPAARKLEWRPTVGAVFLALAAWQAWKGQWLGPASSLLGAGLSLMASTSSGPDDAPGA